MNCLFLSLKQTSSVPWPAWLVTLCTGHVCCSVMRFPSSTSPCLHRTQSLCSLKSLTHTTVSPNTCISNDMASYFVSTSFTISLTEIRSDQTGSGSHLWVELCWNYSTIHSEIYTVQLVLLFCSWRRNDSQVTSNILKVLLEMDFSFSVKIRQDLLKVTSLCWRQPKQHRE